VTAGHALPPEVVAPFRARLLRDADRLATLRATLTRAGAPALAEEPRLAELDRLAHALVGAGATFGFEEITAAAADLERLTGLRSALIATADAEYRRLLLLAIDRLHGTIITADAAAPDHAGQPRPRGSS
jgi:chemotaxis protein histidine kinase CheA